MTRKSLNELFATVALATYSLIGSLVLACGPSTPPPVDTPKSLPPAAPQSDLSRVPVTSPSASASPPR